ncbi:hypothetical protein BSKO_08182 [Bryopsis sp. KO-2023]|nr:hypothetical protein BSKO_08182 [Bryopsis sp. KO-2023]
MVQIVCLTIPLSQGGVPLVARLMGTSVDELSGAGIAWAADFMEVVQLFGVGVLLWVGTKEWPLSPQWLKYEITPKAAAQGGCTFLAAFGGALFLAFLSDVFGGSAEKPIGQELLETNDISTTLGASVLAVLLAPILEELIYRGFLLPSLLKWFKPPAAVAITSAVFAAAHCNPKLSVGFFVAGCAYGGGYVLSGGNLAVATLGHAMYNSAIVVQSIFSITM